MYTYPNRRKAKDLVYTHLPHSLGTYMSKNKADIQTPLHQSTSQPFRKQQQMQCKVLIPGTYYRKKEVRQSALSSLPSHPVTEAQNTTRDETRDTDADTAPQLMQSY